MKVGVVNGLRGYAILGVIYFHVLSQFTPSGFNKLEINQFVFFPFAFLSNGLLGVNLFFILSGFVLYLPYLSGARKFDDWRDWVWFYKRRALRLLPLYYFSVLVVVAFIDTVGDMKALLNDLLLMATVTFNFTIDMWFPRFNGVLWSLGVEIWFSILFPVMVLSINRYGLFKIGSLIFITSLATRIFANQSEAFAVGENLHLNALKDSLLGRLDDFITGMILAHVFIFQKKRIQNPTTLTASLFFFGLLCLFVACSIWDAALLGYLSLGWIPFTNNIVQISAAFIIYALLFMPKNSLRFFFDNPAIQMLGMMCYSLYVWHTLVIGPVIQDQYSIERLALYTVMVFLISAFSYRYIEFGHTRDVRQLFLPMR